MPHGDPLLSLSGPGSSIAFDLHQGTRTVKIAPEKKEKTQQSHVQLFLTNSYNLSVGNEGGNAATQSDVVLPSDHERG